MNITLLTLSSLEYWDILKLSAPNKLEYCLRHKYQLITRLHNYTKEPKNWGEREMIMLDSLSSCDWLFFQGADTLITNMNIPLTSLIDINYDFIITKDINGINNDNMLIKNCQASREFLQKVLYQRSTPNDQDAMKLLLNSESNFKVKYAGQKEFNSYIYGEYKASYPQGEWGPNDFVIHFPGMVNSRRIPLMTEYLGRVVR